MEQKQLFIDINAHLYNIEASISTQNNLTYAHITFLNLGKDTITAVKLEAKAYNAFNEPVLINGKESFYLLIQDISVRKNKVSKNIELQLPNNDIRRLELNEYQICYQNGEIIQYPGPDIIDVTLDKYDPVADKNTLDALKRKYTKHYAYKPLEVEKGWICGCGNFNHSGEETCHYCECKKEDMFNTLNDEHIATITQEYIDKKEFKKEKEMINTFINDEENKKKFKPILIGIAVFALLFTAISIIIPNHAFRSESAMKAAVKGKYSYYTSGTVTRQVNIADTKLTHTYKYITSTVDVTIKEWDYKNGIIKTNTKDVIVNKDGSLTIGEDTYKKGGTMIKSTTSSGTNTNKYETGLTALKLSNISLTSNSSYKVCTGTITNKGSKTYKFVKVKGSFKNASGTVIDTDWTYAVGSEGLAPGESKTFRMLVPKNASISKVSVSIFDYD